MAIVTLIVKKPFTIDLEDTYRTNMLHIDGGDVYDTISERLYVNKKRSIIVLPYNISFVFVYYNIISKDYSVSESDLLENTESKLLFRVQLEDGVIINITDLFSDDVYTNEGNIEVKQPIDIINEQNIIVLPNENGNIIPVEYFPRQILSINVAYTDIDDSIHAFGSLDIENVIELGQGFIRINKNLALGVQKSLGKSIKNIIIDVSYSF